MFHQARLYFKYKYLQNIIFLADTAVVAICMLGIKTGNIKQIEVTITDQKRQDRDI